MLFLKSAVALAISAFVTVNAAETADPAVSNAWQARHGLTSQRYRDLSDDLRSEGYRLNWVSGYTEGDSRRYAAIWEKKSGAAWTSTHDQSGEDFQRTFNRLREEGYHPLLINGYTVDGQARYESIWDKSKTEPWELRFGLTSAQIQSTYDDLKRKGFHPIHLSGYAVGREPRYAGIWVKGESRPWEVRWGYNSQMYQSYTEQLKSKGYHPVQVNAYNVGGNLYYTGIWEKRSGRWEERHGLTPSRYQEEFDDLKDRGFVPTVVSGVHYGDSSRFAAIWEKKD